MSNSLLNFIMYSQVKPNSKAYSAIQSQHNNSGAQRASLSLLSLRKKCPYSGFFWSVFSRIWTEYEEIIRISPHLVQMRENTDQKNSEYGHFFTQCITRFLRMLNVLPVYCIMSYYFENAFSNLVTVTHCLTCFHLLLLVVSLVCLFNEPSFK